VANERWKTCADTAEEGRASNMMGARNSGSVGYWRGIQKS
jgi:hypothetical protein